MRHGCILFGIIIVTLHLLGCTRFVCEIHQQADSRGTINININTDAKEPRINITIDNVTVDRDDLKKLLEKKKREKEHRREPVMKPFGTF